jgi:MFS family permease
MLVANKGWRLMMMLGTLPAVLTFFFRMFVPESSKWEQEQGRGATSQWLTADLMGVLIGALGPALIVWVWAGSELGTAWKIVATLLGVLVATAGYLFPVLRFLQRTCGSSASAKQEIFQTICRMLLAAGLSGVALIGTWGSTQWSMTWAGQLTQHAKPPADVVTFEKDTDSQSRTIWQWYRSAIWKNPREYTQIFTAFGAIVGTIFAAMLGDWIGRRIAYFVLCLISMISVLWFYQFHAAFGEEFLIASFILGTCTASFYGWLPLYLPELFATNVRATGQGFGFNFGRILAAIAGLQVGTLLILVADYETFAGIKGGYPVACSIVSIVYLFGMGLIWFAPETKGCPLPE